MADNRRIAIHFDVNGDELKKLEQATKSIDSFNKHVKTLQQTSGSVANAFKQMNNATKQTQVQQQNLHNMMKGFDGALKNHKGTINSLGNAQNALSQKLSQYGRNVKLSLDETGKFVATLTNLENQTVKMSGSFDATTNKLTNMKRSVSVTNNAVDKMKESIKQARIEAERMRGTDISSRLPQGKSWDVQTQALERHGRVLQGSIDRNNKFTQTFVRLNGEVVKVTGYYNRAKNALVQYNQQVSKASKAQLQQAGFDSSAINRIGQMADSMKGLNRYTLSWNEAMGISALRMVQWSVAGTAIFGTQHALQAMIKTIIELDSQMVALKRVLDDDVNFNALFEGAIRNANTLGIKLTEINESMIEFGRQGFKEGDIETLVKATGLLKNVADMDMTQASENMTAYLATFRKEVSDIGSYVDRLNEVDNKYAVSVDQLSESVRRAGGTANAFGVSIDNLLGYTTAVAEATRESGSVIGNSFKTIFSRITTLKDAEEALKGVGVEIRNTGGDMKTVDQILLELSKKWDTMTVAEKQNLGVTVAGRYQLNRFMILMQNFDKAMMASETATKSWGSAQRENQKYMQSLQAKINQLWTALQLLAKELGDAGIAKAFGAVLVVATKLVTGFTKIVDAMGGFSFTLPVVTGLLTAMAWQFNVLRNNTAILQSGVVAINPHITALGARMGMSTANATFLAGAISRVTGTMKAMALATISNPLFWIPLVITGVVSLVGHLKQLEERQQELAKSTKDSRVEYEKFLEAVEAGTVDPYQVEKYKEQVNLLKEEQQELTKYVKEHATVMTTSNVAYSQMGMNIRNASLSKEELILKYQDETKAMKVLNKEEENLLASMGLKITNTTTISDLTSQMTEREKEMAKAVKDAEKALEEQRLQGILPSADAYYELGEAIDDQATAMENAIGITDKLQKQMREQRAIIQLLSGVKNKDAVQTQLLENAYTYWAGVLGVTEEELKKHPELMNKQIKKNQELLDITGKMADGTASAEERVRAQRLLSAENAEKTAKRVKSAVESSGSTERDQYERTMKKLFGYDEKVSGTASNTETVLTRKTKVVIDKYGQHRKQVDDTISKYNKFKNSVEKASKDASGSVSNMKKDTNKNLEEVEKKTDDVLSIWGKLREELGKKVTGFATVSIKGIFGGLFGSGGNIDGDKLKDSVMSSGGGSIAGKGFGGLQFTSGFGSRKHPITGKSTFHAGMDLAGPVGTPIRARQGGTVVQAGWAGGYGRMVTIMGSNGLEYRYAHNSTLNVRPGQFVPAGMTIAGMGSTGDSTGSHLHFEVRRGGQAINPMPYYHSGGIVSKDRKPNEVDARLQVGEMVINKSQQRSLFSLLNNKNANDVYTGMGGPTNQYRFRDAFQAENYYDTGRAGVDYALRLGIRDNTYFARSMTSPKYHSAVGMQDQNTKQEYNLDVIESLKSFTNLREATEFFKKADLFLNSSAKEQVWAKIKEQVEDNIVIMFRDEATKAVEDFNKAFKETDEFTSQFQSTLRSVEKANQDAFRTEGIEKLKRELLASSSILKDFFPDTTVEGQFESVKSELEALLQQTAELQFDYDPAKLNDRKAYLETEMKRTYSRMLEIRRVMINKGITDEAKLREAQGPLWEIYYNLQAEYNQLVNDMQNGSKYIDQNKSKIEELTGEYERLKEALEQKKNRREFTDFWGNIVRDAEGNAKIITEQGQLIMNTYEQVRREIEAVQQLISGGNVSSAVSPILDQLMSALNAFNPNINATVTPGTAISNNDNYSVSETKTYDANTNVTRNVTYIVQAGVALASESELREFAMLIKDMIDEEEGRSQS